MEFTIGAVANALLVVVNVMDYYKRLSFCPSNIILASLGLTRFGFQCVVIISYFLNLLVPGTVKQEHINKPMTAIWMFFNFSSLWCATWLCVHYCVKIANFTNVAFSFLKLRFSKLLPFLLLASLLVSLAFSLPFMMDINVIFGNGTSAFSLNNTPSAFPNTHFSSWTLFCTLGSSVPFLLFWLAAALLITSLRRHVRRMKGSHLGGFRNPSLKAHCKAWETMIVFFLFYASFVTTVNVSASVTVKQGNWYYCMCAVVASAYPSLHSVSLILCNSKLRETALRALPCATTASRPGEPQVSSITP
ncbi:hypothetical protein NDU88_000306 [Pleurodeles waltl]|uniref:Taste receptor type 2 n=2 Tax=Pleurodeles waltl TaxID=8319 RepID=A0AAV7P3K5_PLEWA|nr:hypothetical protein NDU88_000306 [Pleurodeles waltl]